MKRRFVLGVALLCAALTLSACSGGGNGKLFTYHGAQPVGKLIPVTDRKPVQNFSGSLLDGGTYQLSQYAGKITVVNFWGTWCGPCTVETPQFGLVYDSYQSKGVTFVGIDVKQASRDAPKSFVADHHITYPMVYDEDGDTAIHLGNIPTQAMPFTVILDRQHRVAAVYLLPLTAKDLDPVLNKLIAEKTGADS